MIKHYRLGHPSYETNAVVEHIQITPGTPSPLHYRQTTKEVHFDYVLEKSDIVYGLGENLHGINKRGFLYRSECRDISPHMEGLASLYAAHNFLIIDGEEHIGIFLDVPGIVTFDVGHSDMDTLSISCENLDMDVYILTCSSTKEIVREFRKLIGQSYIPPKWGFGYGQSRFGYKNEQDIQEVLHTHHEHGIPLDALYLDIDYMERYKDFTIDKERFPAFPTFVKKMKKDNIHLVPIIDAAIKIEEGYHVYEEGVKHNYFCKDKDGHDFIAGVWPGRCHFPDVLNTEARNWFGDQYRYLLDQGIDGFWNDMNEPSIFYSAQGIDNAMKKVDELRNQNLDIDSFFSLVHTFSHLSNNRLDYELFYHNVDGTRIRHDAIHNQYGYHMTKAAQEAFQRYDEKKRFLLFSRSSSIGMHRYGGIWTGDNSSWWSHLVLNIKMMPSIQMCGFLYTGADIGGFMEDTTEELLMRWLQFSIFTPLMRNHYCSSRDQEAYQFKNTPAFRNIIETRYALLPYVYSEFMKAALHQDFYFYPIAFDYPQDSIARECEMQLFLGDSIMIAPMYEQNATGRYVYLPEDMLCLTMRSLKDFDAIQLPKGHHYLPVDTHEFTIFIRKNKILVMGDSALSTAQLDDTSLYIFAYVEDSASYSYYHDDGYSTNYDVDQNTTQISVCKDGDTYHIDHPSSIHCQALCIMG